MMKTISKRLAVAVAALSAGLAFGACGDNYHLNGDDAGDDGGDDAQPIDAMPGPDAEPTPSVGGTLAILDAKLTDPSAAAVGGLNGGTFSLSFQDLHDGHGGTVLSGTTNINGCVVKEFTPTNPPNTPLDAGPILIADGGGGTGLQRTVGPCTFNDTTHTYICASNGAADTGVTASGNNATAPGTVALVFSGTPFTGENLQGSWIRLNGFTNTHYNSGALAFPIVAQVGASTLVVADTAGTADAPEVKAAGVSYAVLNGFAPVPGGSDYLGTTSVVIHRCVAGDPAPFACSADQSAVWPEINQTIDVIGQGWTLSDPGNPSAFPFGGAAADTKFGCGNNTTAGNDDTCGDASTALLQGIIIAGVATKQDVTMNVCNGGPCAPFQMPTEVPGTNDWVEFQCAFIGSHTATLDAAAIQAIKDFGPTRVEVRVINAAGAILNSDDTHGNHNINSLNVLVGHAFVGHTDPS
jgi:hypothetical protein